MAGAALLLVLSVALAVAPAQADPPGTTYRSWVAHEDGVAPAPGTTYTWSGMDVDLWLTSNQDRVIVATNEFRGSEAFEATFTLPAGQTLQAGMTYPAEALRSEPAPGEPARLVVLHRGRMCGKTEQDLDAEHPNASTATGSFHVNEISYNQGQVISFAATYQMNCRFVSDQPGFEGSLAVDTTSPAAAVPPEPPTPGPVTGLAARNVGPNEAGVNSTTLTWHNPQDFEDVILDMVQSSNQSKLSDLYADPRPGGTVYRQHLGRASRWYDGDVDFMDTRTYRVVARGPTGRLGPPSLLTVLGSRLSTPDRQRVTIGQPVEIPGRLSESWDYVDFADVMNGPGLVGQRVLLCRQADEPRIESSCSQVDSDTTTTDGHFTLSTTPRKNSLYNIVVPPTSTMVGNIDRVINVEVAPEADLRAREAEQDSARASIERGSIIHFSTARARAGSRGVVRLQRYDGTTWRTIATRSLGGGSSSRARRLAIPFRENGAGRHDYRIVKPGDKHHANGISRTLHVRVG